MSRRNPPRSHNSPTPSVESIQYKLCKIVSRHEQLKVTFNQLNYQMRAGLLEAEDAIASLAIPLMNLVGMKTDEMAAEGRFSTVITSVDCPLSQEENYMNRAMTVCNELMERQNIQLMQQVCLLKKVEAMVNSSRKKISENVADHQASAKKFFLKAFTYVSAIQESGQTNYLCQMMLKILKVTFAQVGVAFGSVEAGVDDIICVLAEKMCNSMVDNVNGLKVELKTGSSSRLLEIVKEMDETIKVNNSELEEARKQARLAEQSRIEALSKLKKSEETARKMMLSLRSLIEDATESENLTEKKEDQAKDDNLLWDLLDLRKKRKRQVADSHSGAQELVSIGTRRNKKLKLTMGCPSISHSPVMRSRSKKPDLQSSSFINSWMLLRPSTSATTQKGLCGKRVTP